MTVGEMVELEYKGFKCFICLDEGRFKVLISGMIDGELFKTPEDILRSDISSIEEAVRLVEPLFHATVERAIKA